MSTNNTERDDMGEQAQQEVIDQVTEKGNEPSTELDEKFSTGWVRELCMPITGDSNNVDPRYGDNYVDIKHEIDKLSGSDYARVFKLAKKVLSKEAKDLRVAGYLVLSGTHKLGVEGLINGLEVYQDLLERYWDDCFPKAAVARASAISWLNNKKIAFFLERNNGDLSQDTLNTLRELVASFNALIIERTGEAAQTFTEVNAWMETAQLRVDEYNRQLEEERQRLQQLEQERMAHEKELALLEELQTDERERGEQVATVSQRLFSVEAHQTIVIQELCKHLHQQNQHVQAVMHARACKWSFSDLSGPLSGEETTEIELPAEIDFEEILTLDEPSERLQACEEIFLLPNAEFCFRLQMITFNSAKEMHDKSLTKTVKQLVGDLFDKFPELMEKSYAEGTPFVDEECKEWIEDIVSSRTELSPLAAIATRSGNADELDTALQQAHEVVEEEDLKAGIKFISNLSVSDELGRVKQKLNMALLCYEQNRSDLALPVLNDLFSYTNRNFLHLWQPELAMVLWQTLHSVLVAEKEKANDFFKEKIDLKLKEISEMMCTADLSMASQLLN